MDVWIDRQVERQASRFAEMIKRLDVDAGKLVRRDRGAAYARARERCLDCRDTRACLSWLDGGQPGSDVHSFCPNASLFDECRRAAAPDWVI